MSKTKPADKPADIEPLSRETLNKMIAESGYQVMIDENLDENRRSYRAVFFIVILDQTHVSSDIPQILTVMTQALGSVWMRQYVLVKYAADALAREKVKTFFAPKL